MPLAAVATAAPASALGERDLDGRDLDGRDASGRDTGDGLTAKNSPGRPAQMGADGIEWHDQIAADDAMVDAPPAALRGEVAKLWPCTGATGTKAPRRWQRLAPSDARSAW